MLRFGAPGRLLQFELEPLALAGQFEGTGAIAPLSLPELLTGTGAIAAAGRVTVTDAGDVVLESGPSGNTQVPITPGSTVLSGAIDVSNWQGVGGQVVVTGTNLFAIDGQVDATGASGGGDVSIGGNWQAYARSTLSVTRVPRRWRLWSTTYRVR